MAIKKTLYEVLQVSRTASGEVITSAYEARLRALGDSAAPEVIAEKGILRDAHAILSDAVRRKAGEYAQQRNYQGAEQHQHCALLYASAAR